MHNLITRQRAGLFTVALLACLVAGCDSNSRRNGQADSGSSPRAKDDSAGTASESEQLHCSGMVDVEGGLVTVLATRNGTIEKLFVKEGDTVSQGAPLLHFASTTEQFAVTRAELNQKAAQSAVSFAKAALDLHKLQIQQGELQIAALETHVTNARMRERATQDLVNLNQASKIELLTAQSQVQEAEKTLQVEKTRLEILKKSGPESKIAEAEQQLAAADAAVTEARYAVQALDMTAHRAGSILRIEASQGSQIAVGQPIAIIAPDAARVIRTQLDADFAELAQVGQTAKVIPDTGTSDSRTWQGKVVSKAPWFGQRRSIGLEPRLPSENRTAECVIELEKDSKSSLPNIGMKVRVVIQLKP